MTQKDRHAWKEDLSGGRCTSSVDRVALNSGHQAPRKLLKRPNIWSDTAESTGSGWEVQAGPAGPEDCCQPQIHLGDTRDSRLRGSCPR